MEGRSISTPLNTPDILPTLLSMSGVAIPETVEGEDLTPMMSDDNKYADRAALIMNVHPFAENFRGSPYRGIRTSRYTYVRKLEGPWLLYDNFMDPYQMNNLVGLAGYDSLQQALDQRLQSQLHTRGDRFLPKEEYLKQWGYEVRERNGEIPYKSWETKVQGPNQSAKGSRQ